MTIAKRLYLVFGLAALALCVAGAAGVFALSQSQKRFEYVQENTIPSISDLDKSINAAQDLRTQVDRHIMSRTSAEFDALEPKIQASLDSLVSLNAYYKAHDISDPKDAEMNDASKANIDAIKAALPAFITKSRANDDNASIDAIIGNQGIGEALRTLVTGLKAQIAWNVKLGNDLRVENSEAFGFALWAMIIGIGTALVLLGGYAISVVQSVRSSLGGIRSTMVDMNQSLNLSSAAKIERMDEIGETATAFNSLLGRFSSVLHIVIGSVDSVRTAAKEIAAGNVDLSARTEQQAASLGETASSMNELTTTVRQNADSAKQANALATNAANVAQAGDHEVQAMVATMSSITNSSSKISDITALIEGIAFQTNILALNAAVEAARAGEQGRGFAVVATEVRTLAQRSASAAKEIKQLISESADLVGHGAEQAARVGATMGQVTLSIKQVADIIGEIAAASEEQGRGIEQVNMAVGQMDEVTQQNAALVEEAAAAAQSLEEQAARLKEAVAVFTVTAITGHLPTGLTTSRIDPPSAPSARALPAPMKKARTTAPTKVVSAVTKPTAAHATAAVDWEAF